MSTIGQIIYNLQDYNSSGGYISTSNSDLTQTISSVDNPSYDASKIDIFNTNIVSRYGGAGFIKLGIQAPPGTKVILNSDKVILVGRTGIYELDDDIVITSMKFVRPKKYVKDEAATQSALQAGIEGFTKAEEDRDAAMADLALQEPTMSETAYWNKYKEIQDTYNEAYQAALQLFNTGLNGVYKLPNPDNPNAEENYQDLYDIIIDFIY